MPMAPEPIDQQRLRHALRHHGLEIGPDQFLVGLEAGQHARPRAGGDDDVLGLIGAGAERAFRRFALAGFHRDFAGRVDRRLAPDHGDLVLLHQKADAVVEPLRHRARALHHGRRIVGDFAGRQPVILGVLQVVENLGRAQQRLGRDAAPVEADAAEIVALDDGGLEAKLRGADGADIAARPRADDDDVEIGLSHSILAKPRAFPAPSPPCHGICRGRRSLCTAWRSNPGSGEKRRPRRGVRGRRSGCRKSSRAA